MTRTERCTHCTIVPGLSAAGEPDGASLHGVNRPGAISLLDLVVVGRQAADTTAELVNLDSPAVQLQKNAGAASTARMDKFHPGKAPSPTADLRHVLQGNTKRFAPAIHNSDVLIKGKAVIAGTDQEMCSAEARKESRGTHAHGDFPVSKDVNWTKQTLSWLDEPYVEDAMVILKYRGGFDQPLLGSAEWVGRRFAKDEKEVPGCGHYQVEADALYAEYYHLTFLGLSPPRLRLWRLMGAPQGLVALPRPSWVGLARRLRPT